MTGRRRRINGARVGGAEAAIAPVHSKPMLPANGFPPALLSLSDAGLEAIMFYAHPLAPAARSQFLAAVAERLAGAEVGEGLLGRICRELQPQYLTPPDTAHDGRWGRERVRRAADAQARWNRAAA